MTSEHITVLGLETSGKIASCAIMRDGVLLGETTFLTKLTHSQIILPTMKRTLSDCSICLSDIGLYAVSAGPGSYTGLRIGIAAVKGLCALGTPCIGVSTLEALAWNAVGAKGRIIPVLAARQGVAYFGAYDSDGTTLTPVCEDRVDAEDGIRSLAESFDGDIILTGDSAERLKAELFVNDPKVRVTPPNVRLQSAAGVCMAAVAHISEVVGAAELGARYLQNTMAEKLRDKG